MKLGSSSKRPTRVAEAPTGALKSNPGNAFPGIRCSPLPVEAIIFRPGPRSATTFRSGTRRAEWPALRKRDFVYIDNRFHWLTVSDDLITVYYYSEYVEERARKILEASRQTMDNMVKVLGIAPTEPLRIVTYNNYRHMSSALPFRSQAVNEELQAQGMAFADERVLLIHGFDPTVTGTVSHEFIHILVAEAAGGTAAAVPSWLNEGLAEYGNIDKTDDYDAALRYGIYTRRIRPLWYLRTFSGEPEDILIAYGQGKSVVSFMVARWGEDRISRLFEVLRDTNDIDTALLTVYGVDQYGLDSAWRQAIGMEPLPSPEELESRLRDGDTDGSEEDSAASEETPSPSDSAAATAEEEAPTPESAAAAEDSADATREPEPAQGDGDGETPSSSGCASPAGGTASIGLGMLSLAAGPLGLGALPFLRRRRTPRE